jgi:hypothetical protein
VAAHKALPPGRHRLTGAYDGKQVRLWIDEKLSAERAASGNIVNNHVPVNIGCIQSGLGQFHSVIETVIVLATVKVP